ncbi:MAG: hypothetical protein JW798_02340, partial [Prolixibacteraceae bacterium]|nr:hypothetical protein [Prolixibacteraceae bacterium]
IEVLFKNFTAKSTLLSVYIENTLVYSEKIDVPQSDYYYKKDLKLNAEKPGLQTVTALLSPLPNESNTANNRASFSVEVHENKYEVLILTQSPHPDIGAISETLKKQANFKITTTNILSFNSNLADYDLVVLNQLPSPENQENKLFQTIKENKAIPVLIIAGPQTSLSALNNLDLGIALKPTLLTQESNAYFNNNFSLFSLPQNIQTISEVYPPLITWYTDYNYSSAYSELAFQKINGIEMNYPLMLTGEIDNRKTGIIAGEGIWRWRLYEYQNMGNQNVFDQLLVNLFNYLCLKEEREQFTIDYRRIASETIPYKIKAQVFNEIYEPVNSAEVKLTLIDSSGSELNYIFDSDNIVYNLNMGYIKPGKYSFEATASLGEKEFLKNGTFNIQEVNIEQNNLKADFSLLKSLSAESGGKFFNFGQSSMLIDEISQNKGINIKTHIEKRISEIIDWKWYLILTAILLSLEWFLRKYWGSY